MDKKDKLDPHGRLKGVDHRLVRVLELTHKNWPYFNVVEGLRSKERQAELVKKGASKTMNSKHLKGHAADIGIYVDGKYHVTVQNTTEWSKHLKAAAKELGVKIKWGGDFKGFFDGPHVELLEPQ